LAIYSQQIKKRGWLGLSLGLVMVAWSLRSCFRTCLRVRTSSAEHPSDEVAQIAISFASASVLTWPVLCIDGKANICLEESLLFNSGIIHLFFLSCDLQFFLVIEESRVFLPFLRVSRRFLFFSFLRLGSKKIVVGNQVWWVLSYLRVSVNGSSRVWCGVVSRRIFWG